jgi:hypothetical protein
MAVTQPGGSVQPLNRRDDGVLMGRGVARLAGAVFPGISILTQRGKSCAQTFSISS